MQGLYKRRRIYWTRFQWNGKRRFVSTGESDEARAIMRAREIQEDPARWLDGSTELVGLVDDYLREKKLRGISERHRENEDWTLKRFLSDLDLSRPRQIRAPLIASWLAPYATKNQKTADDYFDRVRRFCRWLVANGKLSVNPCDEIPRVKPRPRVRRRFLSVDESRALLDACSCPDLKTAIFLALHAGLRKGECLAAQPHWIDLKGRLLHVTTSADWTPKDRDDRTIPISEPFAEWLESTGIQSPWLCWPEKGTSTWRNRKEFRKPFGKLCEEVGLEDVTFHDLRRTFASLHVSAGTSIYKVARWLGDGVAVVERYYGHLTPADDEINRAWK